MAKMLGNHEFFIHGDELEIRTTMIISGPLSYVWRKLIAEGVAKGMEAKTVSLIDVPNREKVLTV